jgi:hypothetical protein
MKKMGVFKSNKKNLMKFILTLKKMNNSKYIENILCIILKKSN